MLSSLTSFALAALAASTFVAAKDISVTVGEGGLKFNPESVTAAAGDNVIFTFKGGNHTVTQSTFANPCTPLAGGADSGFQEVIATGKETTIRLPVPAATAPIWMFCKQGNHCSQGMVGLVSPVYSVP